MTREEAIRILDPETSWEALWEYGDDVDCLAAALEACRVAVTAIRAQQVPTKLDMGRWEGCRFCETVSCEICVNKGDYINCEDGECYGNCDYFEIARFCRRCGKPLTDEACAELERRTNGGTTNV